MTAEQTKVTVLQRIHDLKNMAGVAIANTRAALGKAASLELQGDSSTTATQIQEHLDKALDGMNVIVSFYQKQIDVLTNNPLKDVVGNGVDAPFSENALKTTLEKQEMTQVEGPRPGSAAWRIKQRLNREQGITDVPVEEAAPEPIPEPVVEPIPQVAPVELDPSRTRAARRPDAAERAAMNKRAAELAASIAIKPQTEDTSSLLPSVIEDDPEPVAIPTLAIPPNMYERMTTPKYSPLWRAFAAAPWFPEGTGLINIGQQKWPEITKDLTNLNGRQLISCAQGFYIHPGDTMPTKVLIRLRTFAVLWDFKNEENSIKVFQIGLSDKGTNDYAWFNLGTITSGSIGRLIAELNTYLGTEDVPFNPMG